MASKRDPRPTEENLWARTFVGDNLVTVHAATIRGFDGFTLSNYAQPLKVMIHKSLLKPGREKKLRSVLIHEFIHVLEFMFSGDLFLTPHPEGCTTFAEVIGDHLPELMDNLALVAHERDTNPFSGSFIGSHEPQRAEVPPLPRPFPVTAFGPADPLPRSDIQARSARKSKK